MKRIECISCLMMLLIACIDCREKYDDVKCA